MGKTFYINSCGKLSIKGHTLYFINKDGKRYFPIEQISQIIVTSRVTFTSGSIKTLLNRGIFVHYISQNGGYLGTLLPKTYSNGGLTVSQVGVYKSKRRYEIASALVSALRFNMNSLLRRYNKGIDFSELNSIENINVIRGEEAKSWVSFYSEIRKLINYFSFKRRTFHPPTDEVNSLISFINSLLYSVTLSAIYIANLNPSISFLHEPTSRSFSLALDLADPLKPIITYSLILKLINKKIIKSGDFDRINDAVYLNQSGKRKVIKYFDEKMNATFWCEHYKRNISLKTVLQMEAYKLRRFIIGDLKRYSFFRMRICT